MGGTKSLKSIIKDAERKLSTQTPETKSFLQTADRLAQARQTMTDALAHRPQSDTVYNPYTGRREKLEMYRRYNPSDVRARGNGYNERLHRAVESGRTDEATLRAIMQKRLIGNEHMTQQEERAIQQGAASMTSAATRRRQNATQIAKNQKVRQEERENPGNWARRYRDLPSDARTRGMATLNTANGQRLLERAQVMKRTYPRAYYGVTAYEIAVGLAAGMRVSGIRE